MKRLSQRRAFVSLMSLLATAFVIGVWRQKFSWQADYLGDILKISLFIGISTAAVSFTFWTLTHLKQPSSHRKALARGALAGCITALIIIPLPNCAWNFKTEFLAVYQGGESGLLKSTYVAGRIAIEKGLLTFIEITKASLIAVLGSSLLGIGAAHYIHPKPPSDETA